MNLITRVKNEWEDYDKAISFKIALGKGEATWDQKDEYGFPDKDLSKETILEEMLNTVICTAYKFRHPIKYTKGYFYSLKELVEPSDVS